jgi:type II secretory ATPase GspE/PulE/Tfp pilus assembly ATPase PilB-like protein
VNKSVSLRDLGYAAGHVRLIEDAMRSEGGAMIFAGTVGSGKSTTLAALLSTLPSHRKIMTLEDPVEVFIPGAVQSTLVRDASERDGHGFATKLMALKRSAMTDVLLGEVRDAETGRAFMDLTGSGVSVYTTTHAPSALLAADRLASDAIGVSRDFLATPGLVKLLVYRRYCPDFVDIAVCLLQSCDSVQTKRPGWTRRASTTGWIALSCCVDKTYLGYGFEIRPVAATAMESASRVCAATMAALLRPNVLRLAC